MSVAQQPTIIASDTPIPAPPTGGTLPPSGVVRTKGGPRACMPKIINISGTCPAQMKAKKLPISTSVDAVRTLSDRYLFFCAPQPPQRVSTGAHFPPSWHAARERRSHRVQQQCDPRRVVVQVPILPAALQAAA